MKILHVLDTVDARSGGPIEAVLREAEVLAGLGVDIEIATLDPPGHQSVNQLSFPLHAFGYKENGFGRVMGKTYRYSPQFTRWLRGHSSNYDAVITHGTWCYNTLGVAKALRGSRTPYIVFAHGMLDPWFRRAYPLKHLKKQIYWTLTLGRALTNASRLIFTATDEKVGANESFIGYQNYRAEVVPMGTADVPKRTEMQIEAFHKKVPALNGRKYILFLGRIHPKKGCDLLIEAFAKNAYSFPDVDLVIAGPDATGWRSILEPLAEESGVSDRIHWPGMLTGDSKWGAFYSALCFTLPSHQENFGIAVAEAMACGLPVLITPRINIWREVAESGAGLIGADDLCGTTSTLNQFLAMTDVDRLAMGQASRRAFENHFDVRQTAHGMLSLLKSVL